MNCREFELASVSDDASERAAAERHAADCAGCAGILRGDARLLDDLARWKAVAPAPPSWLEHRIAATLSRSADVASQPALRPRTRSRLWTWAAAAAAVIVLGTVSLYRWQLPTPGGAGQADLEQIALDVERLRGEYVEAIAQLEVRVVAVLAAADDASVAPRRADVLNAYRDRLTHLDAVIADVEGFLDEHAGHAGGHTVLLAALQEKSELLQEVLDLPNGETS